MSAQISQWLLIVPLVTRLPFYQSVATDFEKTYHETNHFMYICGSVAELYQATN